MKRWRRYVQAWFAAAAVVTSAWSQSAAAEEATAAQAPPSFQPPSPAEGVAIEQRLGHTIDLDLKFRDEAGRDVQLRELFGRRPVVLMLGYYECPMLCNQVLHGLLRGLKALEFEPGREYEMVVVSIDPKEQPLQALRKKESFVAQLAKSRESSTAGVHFLTGEAGSIARLADEVGFRYRYDEKSKQYAHAAGIMIATPQGRLARYFYGIDYSTRDLRFAVMEASEERLGRLVDQVLLLCFHYDPTNGRYGVAIMRVMRFAGVLTVCGLGLFVTTMLRRERRRGL